MQETFKLTSDIPQVIRDKVFIPEDLTGRLFGGRTIIRFSHAVGSYKRFWITECKCGFQKSLREDYIRSGLVPCVTCRKMEIRARTGPRKCPGCQQMLSREHYSKDIHTTDKLARYCKFCSRSRAHKLRARRMQRRPEDIKRPETKRCNACNVIKPSQEFWIDRTEQDGLSTKCSDCKNVMCRQWYWKKGRAARLPKARAARYGKTNEEIQEMLKNQDYACQICRKPISESRSYYIDHDHVSGKVRALLCPQCNTRLGMFKESVKLLNSAIEYISTHSVSVTG